MSISSDVNKKINSIIIILILLCFMLMFIPLNYNVSFSVNDGNQQIQYIEKVEYDNESSTNYYNNQDLKSITIPFIEDEIDGINIYTDSENINMTLKYNDIDIRKFGSNPIHNNGKIEYNLSNDDFKDYSLEELLDSYNEDKYLVLMVVYSNFYEGVTDSVDYKLKSLGVEKTPLDSGEFSSFYAVFRGGELFESECSNEESLFFERVFDGHVVNICSGGKYVGNWADICIDDNSYCKLRKGLNVVVYDLEKDELTDSVIYQDYIDAAPYRNIELLRKPIRISCKENIFDIIEITIKIFEILKKVLMALIIVLIVAMRKTINTIHIAKLNRTAISKRWFTIHQFFLTILIMLTLGLGWGYSYINQKFADVTISQLLFNMTTNLNGTNWSEFRLLFIELGVSIIASILFICIFSFYVQKKKWYYRFLFFGLSMVSVCIGGVGNVLIQFNKNFGLSDYVIASQLNTNIYEDYYVNPRQAEISFPENRKNLIYIFIESMEVTNTNRENGGGKTTDFIPELTSMALENECFNGNSSQINGAYVLGNANWTVAALVAQTSGIPLNFNSHANREDEEEMLPGSYSIDSFLPGAYTLGDVLCENGYNNCLLIGSDKAFANRGLYFEQHGNYEICDYEWAIEDKRIPKDYFEWWGYEDVKLFNIAKEKITEMAKSDAPFNMTLLTTDTHFIDGYVCELCQEEYSQQYSNVLSCNSKQIADLIEWLEQQDFYEDTVVVLAGDHLCMDSSYFKDIPDEYERKVYVNILNSDKYYDGEPRIYCTMDMFPTTLSALGCIIEGGRLGLGTDLYSDKQTLSELLGGERISIMNLDFSRNIITKKY